MLPALLGNVVGERIPVPSKGGLKASCNGGNQFCRGGIRSEVEIGSSGDAFDLTIRSVEKMVETYTHPLYKEMVSPDEAKFAQGPMKWVVTEEVKQWDHTRGS